jgi:predicted PurR-regulated permease PerM
MHMLLVFFGIFGGMIAFGLIGLFTGPLVITLFLFLLEVARRDFFRESEGPRLDTPGAAP